MEDLRALSVFAAVVHHGSMSGAARALGMSPSAVSQQVRALERSGGVTLLHRTTRRLALTEAGERVHAAATAMVVAADLARAELSTARHAPSGELRLAAPVGFARHVAPALGGLLADHPALRLRLLVDDAPIDLTLARIDLAIRFGRLPDLPWAARRLCSFDWWICASPAWLAAHGEPATPEGLLGQTWLGFANEAGGLLLDLQGPQGQRHSLRVQPRLASNNQLSLQQMCEAGLGLGLMGSVDVQEAVAAGRLLQVLPQWQAGRLDISALTPQRDAQPAKVRLAVESLAGYLRALPGMRE